MENPKYVTVNGIKTRYFDEGAGEPLILFHGGSFGNTDNVDLADNWDRNWSWFLKSFHVYAPDKLGQGFTELPQRDDDYTMAAVVQHAYDFIQKMGLKKVHLVGHSRGGFLVTRLALQYPELVQTLVIVDSGTLAPGENPSNSKERSKMGRAELLSDAPKPLLSLESLQWVSEAFSSSKEHVTGDWIAIRHQVANLPQSIQAIEKMSTLFSATFLPQLARQKEETLQCQSGNQKMGLKKVHLVGHSRGGFLVTRLALQYPELVQTLVIVDSGTLAPGENPSNSKERSKMGRAELLSDAPKPLLSLESLQWVSEAFSSSKEHVTGDWIAIRHQVANLPQSIQAIEKMSTLFSATFLPQLARQKEETLQWIQEGRLKTPTLLVWGYNDPSALISGGIELFGLLAPSVSRAQMHIFNNAGHYSYREYPEDFARVVSDFIRGGVGTQAEACGSVGANESSQSRGL